MLELKNISFSVDGKDILKNISFVIGKGEHIVITGKNGSGKSTLAKLVMGLITPTAGKIFFSGIDITNMSITDRAKLGIAYAFQTPVHFKGMSIQKMLSLSAGKQKDANTFCDTMHMVGLCPKEYGDRDIDKRLSGGELKRVELASALIRNANLTIFDEPEAGVDIFSFKNIVDIFTSLTNAYIIISHNQRIIEYADKVILLENGTILDSDKAKSLLCEMGACRYKGGANE